MPRIVQSLKTNLELITISLVLMGMIYTGFSVWKDQGSRLDTHEKDIQSTKVYIDRQATNAQALESVITSTVIPAMNAQNKEIIGHGTRLDTMERNARADREILIEIRADLKWIKERSK